MGMRPIRTARCSCCASPDRARLDWLLATGAEVKPTAEQFGVSRSALTRHYARHVSERFKMAAKIGPFSSEEELRKRCAENGSSVLDKMRLLESGLMSRWLTALEAGCDHQLVTLTARLQENLISQAKITRELMPPPANLTINAHLTEEWFADFATGIMGLVERHPAIREDLVALLRQRLAPPPDNPEPFNVTPRALPNVAA